MKNKTMTHTTKGGGNAVYFFGMIGAAVFYVQEASGFFPTIGALLKALVWPAFVIYDLLKFIT